MIEVWAWTKCVRWQVKNVHRGEASYMFMWWTRVSVHLAKSTVEDCYLKHWLMGRPNWKTSKGHQLMINKGWPRGGTTTQHSIHIGALMDHLRQQNLDIIRSSEGTVRGVRGRSKGAVLCAHHTGNITWWAQDLVVSGEGVGKGTHYLEDRR